MVTAIVLAAGLSSRMGAANKLLLPLGAKLLLQHTLDQLLASNLAEIIVVLGHEKTLVRPAIEDRAITIIDNPNYQQGMTTSIQAGIKALPEQVKGIMVCLSDLPLIQAAEYNHLLAAFQQHYSFDQGCIVMPTYQSVPGNPVLFSHHFFSKILAHKELTGCKGIIKAHPGLVKKIPMEHDHIHRDVDTPDAYQKMLQVWQ